MTLSKQSKYYAEHREARKAYQREYYYAKKAPVYICAKCNMHFTDLRTARKHMEVLEHEVKRKKV